MTRWEVLIHLSHKFSDIELNRWLHLFDSPDCKATQAADDGSYYLTACRLEKLNSADEVNKSANKLITMMTAIAKIEMDMDFQSIEKDDDENLARIVRENAGDSSNVTAFLGTAKGYASAIQPTVEIRDEHGNIVTQPRQARWYDRILDQCDGSIYNKPEFTALSYFAQKTEARTVRLTYETIQDDEGDDNAIVNNGWVSQDELKRFRCSLNRQDIDSPELHPKVAADPKCTMNIDDARTFCAQKLLKPWLIKKTI
jgi:hypothetical protein